MGQPHDPLALYRINYGANPLQRPLIGLILGDSKAELAHPGINDGGRT